ncbi:NUDIX hydrolase [Galbibacter mesophilus]|uniref:NUDIX hydrolase n=1 Tax=Galbibacter mesophilus TaxID=379069 RepID=UPI00191E61E4|nr:NUDIX domain-containing protein [Galbibacter mesophilus]MCM5663124.1 NUDIX hydrolase [Galbibacter mesophilus]
MKVNQHIKVAVDAVVFGYTGNELELLLIQQKYGSEKNKWALPGGFLKDEEDLQTGVARELNEETGVNPNYLEQLFTFGSINRDPRGRVISVSYMALINPKNYVLKAATDASDAKWFSIKELPPLAYDHPEIVKKGLERLKSKIHYQPIGFELLNKEFPFSDLEKLYQTILDKSIDRRNFRKKMLSFGVLEETDKSYKPSSGRPAKLFKFNKRKYNELEEKGFHFEIKFA